MADAVQVALEVSGIVISAVVTVAVVILSFRRETRRARAGAEHARAARAAEHGRLRAVIKADIARQAGRVGALPGRGVRVQGVFAAELDDGVWEAVRHRYGEMADLTELAAVADFYAHLGVVRAAYSRISHLEDGTLHAEPVGHALFEFDKARREVERLLTDAAEVRLAA